jgi:proteasome lid subunit RPN8/RPN11
MITIETEAWNKMSEDAERTFPDECCGFFFGTETDGSRTVKQVLVVNNAKEGDKRRRFEVAPKDYLKAEAFAEDHGLALLGVYHSHPGAPPVPSETDRQSAQPYFSYIIISVSDGTFAGVRSWRLQDDLTFLEETISIPQTIKQ